MARDKSYISAQKPLTNSGFDGVSLGSDRFDSIINDKGYEVILEKAYTCPCRVDAASHSQRSDCRNCGGSGWLFVNPTKTKMILSSMNLNTDYKEWSNEKLGTVSVTTRRGADISFMDRITLQKATTSYSEIINIIDVEDENSQTVKSGFTFYDIEKIEALFLFVNSNEKLRLLKNVDDYTFSYNRIILSDEFAGQEGLTLSIRYSHKPQFLVIDLSRDIMNSPEKDNKTGYIQEQSFPLHAVARRAHYILDAENFLGNRMLDNSYDIC